MHKEGVGGRAHPIPVQGMIKIPVRITSDGDFWKIEGVYVIPQTGNGAAAAETAGAAAMRRTAWTKSSASRGEENAEGEKRAIPQSEVL